MTFVAWQAQTEQCKQERCLPTACRIPSTISAEMTTKAVKHNTKLTFKHFPYLCYVSPFEKVKAELQQLKEI